ncbi:MAG: LytTR family DNA-binding domain-containing protein [Erythrobacter sp.]
MVRMTLGRTQRLLAELGIVLAIACLVALIGPFDPPGTPLGTRLAFALAGFVGSWVLVRLVAIVGASTARLLGLGPVWGYAFAVPIASALIAWAFLWSSGGRDAALGAQFASVWPQTILIAAGFFALFFVIYWRAHASARGEQGQDCEDRSKTAEPSTDGAREVGVGKSALHERLPAHFPAILALSVEDHYVRVLAADRSEMLLMPLAQAAELMPPGAGQQVHRSWWVARSAVTGHRREGRDIRLELEGGLVVPVSRAMVKPLRNAGWL